MVSRQHPAFPTPPLKQKPRPKSKQRWLPWLIAGGTVTVGLAMLGGMVGLVMLLYLSEARIPAGVSVGGLPLGGKSLDSATNTLEQSFARKMIAVTDGDRRWQVSLAELGVEIDADSSVEAAQKAAPNSQLQPRYQADLNQIQNSLVALSEQVNIDAVPGNPPQVGRAIEIPVVLDRLRIDLTGELADGVLDLSMIEVQPPDEASPNRSSNGDTTTHVVERGQELALIAREYGVTTDEIVSLNNIANPDLLYVGQELLIPAGGVYTPSAADAPPAPLNAGKSIVVSTGQQRIYAYENGQLVRSHLVSTGRAETPTVLGDYKVYVRYAADDMAGPGYFLPQVPFTMYFFQGYAIHGTYWHNSFGRPMSHGCVNLPVDEAQWFFDWAAVGTLVRVI